MSLYRKNLGKLGEDVACKFLKSHKYEIIDRNFRSRFGEIDIIAMDSQRVLVFIEVKTRTNDNFGLPEESVTYSKQQKIIKTISFYLQRNQKFVGLDFRIDVISVKVNQSSRRARIKHIKNAVNG